MIHPSLIDSARIIKRDYDSLKSQLKNYESEISQLSRDFTDGAEQVKKIEKDINKKNLNLDVLKQNLMDVLNGLESKYNVLLESVKTMNQKMEKLKEQELNLYNVIKTKYPSLTDEEIKIEIHKNI